MGLLRIGNLGARGSGRNLIHAMKCLPDTTDRRRLYLMRHGHVDYFAHHVVESGNTHAVTLTVRGRSEAEAAGSAFSHTRFDRAICSGLLRTKEDGGSRSLMRTRCAATRNRFPTSSKSAAENGRRPRAAPSSSR